MIHRRRLLRTAAIAAAASRLNAQEATFEGQPAIELSNGRLRMTVLPHGAALASLVMADDGAKLNPLWNPARLARDAGRAAPAFTGALGHFVCVDGFGQPSADERAAGFPQHGEAHLLKMDVTRKPDSVTLRGTLPIMQEVFTRTFSMVPGESIVYVDSLLENLLGFDRPVAWAEHATVDSPFLEGGKAVIFLSGTRSKTRPYNVNQPARGNASPRTQRRLKPGEEFTWPMAPGLDGGKVDLSAIPTDPHYLDHSATLFDPARKLQWVAALNPEKHLIYGYMLRREDYPWIQHWGNYASPAELVRGMEFGTQPYDVPHREAIGLGSLFGTPAFRWLPAKGKIESHFLLFYSRTPEGFRKVDDVRLENGSIEIEDLAAGKRLTLPASRGF